MANTSFNFNSLDFDSSRNSLLQFLKSQNRFKDYDFEGSNISVLLDVLAYNAHLQAFYNNMIVNEVFMDTAQLRDNVISHAKDLNYVPRSFRSAEAKVIVSITTNDLNKKSILIPKGTTFSSRLGNRNFTFSTNENIILNEFISQNSTNKFISEEILIYEGDFVIDSFSVLPNEKQRYILSNQNVDISSLSVTIIEDQGSTTLPYKRSYSLFDIDETSKIFFVQGAEKESYEIFFGDGVSGRKPKDNSVVLIESRVCNGELPNGCDKFTIDGSIDGESNISVATVSAATGGTINETTESIKFNAPRHFATQERAITTQDYETLLKRNFPEINTVIAYGGEEVSPPEYGKVFVSVDLNELDGLPDIKKNEYYNFLKPRSPLSIEPVFVEPQYLYVDVDTLVKYNINITSLNPNDISTLVLSSILEYSQSELNKFAGTLRYSKFTNKIDLTNSSIVSNETSLRLTKYYRPIIGNKESVTINFETPLLKIPQNSIPDTNSFESSNFIISGQLCYLEDDGLGNIRIIRSGQFASNIGIIDYESGKVEIKELQIDSFNGNYIKFYAKTRGKDITSSKNVILNINEGDVKISVVGVRE